MLKLKSISWVLTALAAVLVLTPLPAWAQAVCLPAPRLLTTMPMGAKAGTEVEVTIAGDNIEGAELLRFSHPGITATPKLDAQGKLVANSFIVKVASDCPAGVHEARLMTRLGVSSSRVFNVGRLDEFKQESGNTTLAKAMPLPLNSVCNAVMSAQAIDYYAFEAQEGQRVVVDCAAEGIDSKLKPVLIVADANGADLLVERRGGAIDFTAPASGRYVVKVHELTYKGGREYFYRLALRSAEAEETVPRLPSTRSVSSFSWPPTGLAQVAAGKEVEPNNRPEQAQRIELPCDLAGSFFPAADVDTFEFEAKQGEVWWVEVASERLGRPTDASVVVQHVAKDGAKETLTDVAELNDIPSPVKVSSNGYSYDGPPYNAGSTDILGKIEIKADGLHRLQIRDLFGGTRKDPNNVYRLVVRKAAPDFALVGWALHMNLRNGDRNALSKPIALRGGATMPIEVVVVRRDGFNGPIQLAMENLPAGVTATGLLIPAGQSRGIMLVTAAPDAPRGLSSARFYGEAELDGKTARRRCFFASMKWPVPDASQQIPSPRLVADVPVSVSDAELAPLTIAAEKNEWEATQGEKLTIPLQHTRRCDFSGANISLRTYGAGFEGRVTFDAPLGEEQSTATLDLAALKTPPGEYTIAFYGSAVAKYRYNPTAINVAKLSLQTAEKRQTAAARQAAELAEAAQTAPADLKAEAAKAAQLGAAELASAKQAVAVAQKNLQDVTRRAQPKDIVDIIVSTPITIRVKPAEKK